MIALSRLGGVLTIVGIVAVALIGIRGIIGLAGIMPIYSDPGTLGFASLMLLGGGAVAIGLGAHGALAATMPRYGLLLFAIGCFSIALLATQEVVPGSLGVGTGLIIVAGTGLLAPIGLLLIGGSLVRSRGRAMPVGLLICVGGLLAVLGLFSSSVLGYDLSRGILLLGASVVGAGLVGVALLAASVGRPPATPDEDRRPV